MGSYGAISEHSVNLTSLAPMANSQTLELILSAPLKPLFWSTFWLTRTLDKFMGTKSHSKCETWLVFLSPCFALLHPHLAELHSSSSSSSQGCHHSWQDTSSSGCLHRGPKSSCLSVAKGSSSCRLTVPGAAGASQNWGGWAGAPGPSLSSSCCPCWGSPSQSIILTTKEICLIVSILFMN